MSSWKWLLVFPHVENSNGVVIETGWLKNKRQNWKAYFLKDSSQKTGESNLGNWQEQKEVVYEGL